MKQSECNTILASELGDELAVHKFKYVKSINSLVRELGDISQRIEWHYTSRRLGLIVTPMLAVRSEFILEILKKVQQISKADEKFQVALSVDVWRLGGDESRGTFYVETEGDVKRSASAIAALVRSDALPFFERCMSICNIDQLFNAAPNAPSARLISSHNWKRSANALIAARLAGNPKYDGLVDVYRATIGQFSGGQFLPQYESLIRLLKEADRSAASNG